MRWMGGSAMVSSQSRPDPDASEASPDQSGPPSPDAGPIRVSDAEVAALRAYVTGNLTAYRELRERFQGDQLQAFVGLVSAAFLDAVDLRFDQGRDLATVVTYVAGLRARSRRHRKVLDPVAAERLLLFELGGGTVDDLDKVLALTTKQQLLRALIPELGLTEVGLDRFLNRARRLADTWLARMSGREESGGEGKTGGRTAERAERRNTSAGPNGARIRRRGRTKRSDRPKTKGKRLRRRWEAWLIIRARRRSMTREVTVLRAYLADDWRLPVRSALLAAAMDPLSIHLGVLVHQAFYELTRRAFPPGSTTEDVRRFVDRCPELHPSLRDLDPRLATEMILAALAYRPEPRGPRK